MSDQHPTPDAYPGHDAHKSQPAPGPPEEGGAAPIPSTDTGALAGSAAQTISYPVIGMTCANCALAVERALVKKTPGVSGAHVNLADEQVTVVRLRHEHHVG